MINKVILVGHLGRDPEIRSTASGTPVGNFSLATNRQWKDRDGQRQEETEWHQIVVWGRQAEIAGQYLSRGKQIYVEGRLQTRSWEDRQSGEKRFKTEVVCEIFKFLGGRGDSGPSGPQGPPPYEPPGGSAGSGGSGDSGGSGGSGPVGGNFEPEDDDIPF
ncbi:MAG: single-stranded DNA-binding protein [bacterium]|nr:single-stranded DNA-binding protein [bacterium]